MRTPLIKDGEVVNVVELAEGAQIVTAQELARKLDAGEDVSKCWVVPDGQIVGPDGGEIGDVWDGADYVKPQIEAWMPSLRDYERAIARHIDTVARSKGYRNAESCASYTASTVPEWAAESNTFVAWRDAVWVYVFAELDKVQKELREQPSIAEFLAELPGIEWP